VNEKRLKMAVGDLDSNKKGSAARANGGKPNYALFLGDQLELLRREFAVGVNRSWRVEHLYHVVGNLQRTQSHKQLKDLLVKTMEFSVGDACTIEGFYDVIEGTIRVLEYGQEKYASWNWAKGQSWSTCVSSYMRHLVAIDKGEYNDPESGQPHWAHMMCNAMFLYYFGSEYPEGNDLLPKFEDGE
jgi:hypothetical protein